MPFGRRPLWTAPACAAPLSANQAGLKACRAWATPSAPAVASATASARASGVRRSSPSVETARRREEWACGFRTMMSGSGMARRERQRDRTPPGNPDGARTHGCRSPRGRSTGIEGQATAGAGTPRATATATARRRRARPAHAPRCVHTSPQAPAPRPRCHAGGSGARPRPALRRSGGCHEASVACPMTSLREATRKLFAGCSRCRCVNVQLSSTMPPGRLRSLAPYSSRIIASALSMLRTDSCMRTATRPSASLRRMIRPGR
ncbi:hypothetical protein D9M72_441230 [compost metagenome]